MTVNNTAKRDIYRPTMRRELKEPGNKGVEVIMVETNSDPAPPEPEREPITVVMPAKWADVGNTYAVGETVSMETAGYAGGLEESTTYRWRIQTRDDADSDWVNGSWTAYTDPAEEVTYDITAPGQIRFQCQARDTGVDPVEQVNSFASVQTVDPPSALSVTDPVVTGEPYVGDTLTCSEPTVTGGIGPYQFDYFWVDESNVIVWEAPKMQPNTLVTTFDIGKLMKCLVTVTDKGWSGGESLTVESNSIGPIAQRTIGNVVYTVDGSVVTDDAEDAVATRNGSEHIIVMTPDGNATGMTYDFDIRLGEARITQSANSAFVSIMGSAPGSVQIQCSVNDINTVEQSVSQRVIFVIGE